MRSTHLERLAALNTKSMREMIAIEVMEAPELDASGKYSRDKISQFMGLNTGFRGDRTSLPFAGILDVMNADPDRQLHEDLP